MSTVLTEDRCGWPAQPRPDRKLPAPWSLDLLVGVDHLHHHALAPDGRRAAFVWLRDGHSDLWLAPTDGCGWPQRLTFDRPAQTFWSDAAPSWSPDGRWLVYAAQGDLWAVPVGGGRPQRLTDFKHGDSSPVFSPDGGRVYFVSGRGEVQSLCYTTLEAAWPVQLTRLPGDVSDPRPAPDGQHIVFVYHPPDDLNRSQICLVPADGGEVRHLTGAPGVWDGQPRWAPDGRSLAFLSNRSGWRELYRLDLADGSVTQVTAEGADVQSFAWSPDGRQMALVVNRQGAGDLCRLDLASGGLRTLAAARGWHSLPQWSRDGRWLSVEFESPRQPPDLYRVDAATGAATPLTFSQPPALAATPLVQPEFVRYSSTDGATIPAFLFRPAAASAQQPCPAIVYPHGGPTDEYALTWDILVQWLVAKGYAVLTPNYRGSTGYGLAHQHALHGRWGIVDTADMLAAADFLAGLEWVDGQRLAIYGASYGSYLAVLALARDPVHRYRCGVAKFGDCDILASWAQGDRVGREDLERQMGHPTANRAGYRAGSPIYDVANIQAPLLVLHGEKDDRVHPKQSQQLVEALKREGKTFEYFLYAGEGHGFLRRDTLLHFYATLERFLDWYLL